MKDYYICTSQKILYVGDIRVKVKTEIKTIKDKIISDIRNTFELENEHYYKPVRIGNCHSNNYKGYEISGDRGRKLSNEENLYKIKLYLKDIIIDLQKSYIWKIQLTIAVNLIFSKYTNEERTMLLKFIMLKLWLTIIQMKLLKKFLISFFLDTKWV